MLWARSKNAKRRLEAIVEAMGENIENKYFFLLENYYNSLGIKGFRHNCTDSLRTASVCSTGTYAQPCIHYHLITTKYYVDPATFSEKFVNEESG